MRSTGFSGRFVSLLISGMLISLLLSSGNVYAGCPCASPAPVFVEPMQDPGCYPPVHKKRYHRKKHHAVIKRHYYRHAYSYAVPVCVYRYHPQPEIVAFLPGAPSGRGRYVNLNECEPYDPDMSTGDDDPTIYPGMNIDN